VKPMRTKHNSIRPGSSLPGVIAALALLAQPARAQTGPSITLQPASQTNLAGANAILSVAVSGSGPFTYQWQLNGTNLPNDLITTAAGSGGPAYAGDGAPAAGASLNDPDGVAVDASGNLVIADQINNRIRKVDVNGIITTVAGNGLPGYSGDGRAATNTSLWHPQGVAVDASGNLFIADNLNQRARQVDVYGIITTVAGNGSTGYSGDGAAGTDASLWYPQGVAVDASGKLFIADSGNNRIRKVALGGFPTLALGNLSAYDIGDYQVIIGSPSGSVTSAVAILTVLVAPTIVTQPANLAVNIQQGAGLSVLAIGTQPLLYSWYFNGASLVASGTNSIFSLASASLPDAGGYTVVVANDFGSVTSLVATLSVGYPPAITSNPSSQTVYAGFNAALSVGVAGTGPFNYQWRLNGINLPNNFISTVAGNGSYGFFGDGGAATRASLETPSGMALDASGALFIADSGNNVIRKVDAKGMITTVAGNGAQGYSGDGGPASSASLNVPTGVWVDASGSLLIADSGNDVIRKVSLAGFPALTLSDVSSASGGAYQVVITSPYDSVTSAVAALTVASPTNQNAGIVMSVPVVAGGNLLLGFSLSPPSGASCALLQAPKITGPWTINTGAVLTTNTQAGAYQFSIPTPGSAEFYQVRSP
jgi:sugar lactone lactonase YvrE